MLVTCKCSVATDHSTHAKDSSSAQEDNHDMVNAVIVQHSKQKPHMKKCRDVQLIESKMASAALRLNKMSAPALAQGYAWS